MNIVFRKTMYLFLALNFVDFYGYLNSFGSHGTKSEYPVMIMEVGSHHRSHSHRHCTMFSQPLIRYVLGFSTRSRVTLCHDRILAR